MGIFPTRILLATDGSAQADLAGEVAVELANETGSELHLVCVGEFAPPPDTDERSEQAMERAVSTTRRVLNERAESIVAAGGVVSGVHARLGCPADEILTLAEEMGAGLLVVGSRGLGGLKRAVLGSVSDPLVRGACCPVMVVRGAHGGEPAFSSRRILAAFDGSEEAEPALRTAVDLAKGTSSELHVVTVGREHRPEQEISEYGEQLEGMLRGRAISGSHVRSGERSVDEEIVALGEELDVDLIVLGSRGLSGARRALMGSVSDSVVRTANCPVLVVRQAKEASLAGEEAEVEPSFSPLTSPCLATAS